MSTKTTDTNSIQYDPGSKGVYGSLQSPIGNTLTQYMQNPLQSSFFNQRVGMGQNQISKSAAAGTQAMMSNLRASGMGGGTTNPFVQSMIARQGRQTSAAMSNNFMGQLFNANQMQLGATGLAQGYSPLMTGSTSVQQKSGLGTWLPQLLSAGASFGLGMFGGGGLGGGLMGGLSGGGASSAAPTGIPGVSGIAPGSYSSGMTMNPLVSNYLFNPAMQYPSFSGGH